MRHGKSFNHLGRTAPHRQAMLSNMASSLIQKKRITTTVAKAKALRKYVEPIITKAKDDTTQSRRVAFSYLQDKGTVQMLFDEVAAKVADRPGGYTRIIKLAEKRLGDNSNMCIIELVDYNSLMLEESAGSKAKTRRSRRSSGSKKATDNVKAAAAEGSKEKKAEAKKEAKADSKKEGKTETTQEVKAEAKNEEAEAKKEDKPSSQDAGAEEKSPEKDDKNKEGQE